MRKETVLLSALICILVTGCFYDDAIHPQKQAVYVAGSDQSLNGFQVAVYWKDGNRVPLGDSTSYSVANSIFVTYQNDVYVAGFYQILDNINYNYNTVAMLWKNGKAIPLTDGKNNAEAFSVTVADGNVYVAGYEATDRYYARCWKNGDPSTLLHPPLCNSVARSVLVKNGDVYVAGSECGQLAYWKNGVLHSVPDNHVQLETPISFGIADGDDIYMSTTGSNGILYVNYFARFWRNDIQYYLPTGMQTNGMTVSSLGDVYIAGSKLALKDSNNPIHVAKYWKNGKSVDFTDSTTMSWANAIAVNGNDVYIAGNRGLSHGVYWRNGVEVPLTGNHQSFANAIFVR